MLVSNFNANTTNYHRKMEAVYATMDKLDLPLKLRERVKEYYTHVWLEYEALDGNINKFEQELTHTLRIEIGLYKFMNLVVKISFWEDCTPDFLTQIVLSLGVRVYMPDDYVVRRREIGSEMMMINMGYCKLSKPMKHNEDIDLTAADFSDDTEKPLLMPEDLGSPEQPEADEASNDEWDDTSSDEESNDELGSEPFGSPATIRRLSGSVFELQCGDADNSTAEIKTDRPRRHSNPSSVEVLNRPKKFRVYLNPGTAFGEMSLLMNYKRQANVLAVTFVEIRVMRVANHVGEWIRYSRYSHLIGIAQLMWLVLLIAHYMACFWHVVTRGHSTSDSQQHLKPDLTVGEQYVADYYYAVSLIQGQGNASGTWGENLYSSVAIIVGSVTLAIVFGNVAMLVSNFNANTTNYHRKMEAVYATMDKMDLPLKLRERVNEYYAHVWLEYEALDGNIHQFQQDLTHTLGIEIGLYKHMNLIVVIQFWEFCTPDFLTQIVLNLDVRVYMPHDYVVRRHEIGSEMMMINRGTWSPMK
ncbi:Voltage-gated Ion Channel (VIC) Superfamily [Phytophthora cinnamomi]|uniref:Voltage-gated Ion Channel (VIC) Superfamily n=1 Tax=Phytophthora cinnamomi TaxID=4785 RepID=UPI0035593FB9|nr:Voltage-gated Ion Channel (VIC) Superfamily [Phytophthora cinnamomi]